jgi:hypothetical protein
MYRALLVTPAAVGPLLDDIRTNPQYISATIQTMTLPQVRVLNDAFNAIQTVRESTVLEAMLPTITPNHGILVNRIGQVTAQLDQLNTQKEALETLVATSLTEEFYGDTQYNFNALFDLTTERKKYLEDRLMDVAPAAPAAAAAADDMDL